MNSKSCYKISVHTYRATAVCSTELSMGGPDALSQKYTRKRVNTGLRFYSTGSNMF
jgi:hypothetical protein